MPHSEAGPAPKRARTDTGEAMQTQIETYAFNINGLGMKIPVEALEHMGKLIKAHHSDHSLLIDVLSTCNTDEPFRESLAFSQRELGSSTDDKLETYLLVGLTPQGPNLLKRYRVLKQVVGIEEPTVTGQIVLDDDDFLSFVAVKLHQDSDVLEFYGLFKSNNTFARPLIIDVEDVFFFADFRTSETSKVARKVRWKHQVLIHCMEGAAIHPKAPPASQTTTDCLISTVAAVISIGLALQRDPYYSLASDELQLHVDKLCQSKIESPVLSQGFDFIQKFFASNSLDDESASRMIQICQKTWPFITNLSITNIQFLKLGMNAKTLKKLSFDIIPHFIIAGCSALSICGTTIDGENLKGLVETAMRSAQQHIRICYDASMTYSLNCPAETSLLENKVEFGKEFDIVVAKSIDLRTKLVRAIGAYGRSNSICLPAVSTNEVLRNIANIRSLADTKNLCAEILEEAAYSLAFVQPQLKVDMYAMVDKLRD